MLSRLSKYNAVLLNFFFFYSKLMLDILILINGHVICLLKVQGICWNHLNFLRDVGIDFKVE